MMIVPSTAVAVTLGLAVLAGVDSRPEPLLAKRQDGGNVSSGEWSVSL